MTNSKILSVLVVLALVCTASVLLAVQAKESGDKAHWGVAAIRSNGDFDTDGDIVLTDVTASGNITSTAGDISASAGDVSATQTASGTVSVATFTAGENADAKLILDADDGDDNADTWTIESEATGNDLSVVNHTTEVLNLTSAGNLQVDGSFTASSGNITASSGNLVGDEATVDGKYAVTGGDATTGLMIQKAAITSTATALQTNSFAVTFGAAPTVVCTYTEDPGDVRPIFVTTVTASNFVASVTADKNFAYIAVGTRP
jgi:hypothetical protein